VIVHPSLRPATEPLHDFGGYHPCAGAYFAAEPRDAAGLEEVVRAAFERRLPIRVRGHGHSQNGSSLPRAGEILISTAAWEQYRFERPGTVTVGAGAVVWDVNALLKRRGFRLPVCNDGGAAATVGGFVSAGGFGAGSAQHGGFWEAVDAIRLVTGDGRRLECGTGDALFPWLFGSMGQLGVVHEAVLRIHPAAGEARYPGGEAGVVPRSEPHPETLFWYVVFAPAAQNEAVRGALLELAKRHGRVARPRALETYPLPFGRFNPPLVHPLQESLVAVGLWVEPPDPFVPNWDAYRDLERDFAALVRSHPSYRRYAQTELLYEDFRWEGYLAPEVLEGFAAWKSRLDPAALLGRGVLPSSASR
jgi:hypothetical protein